MKTPPITATVWLPAAASLALVWTLAAGTAVALELGRACSAIGGNSNLNGGDGLVARGGEGTIGNGGSGVLAYGGFANKSGGRGTGFVCYWWR